MLLFGQLSDILTLLQVSCSQKGFSIYWLFDELSVKWVKNRGGTGMRWVGNVPLGAKFKGTHTHTKAKLIQSGIEITDFSFGSGSSMALWGTVSDPVLVENRFILFPMDFCIHFGFQRYRLKHYIYCLPYFLADP